VLLFVDADCLLPSNLVETVFLALGDPNIVGGATGFAPAKGKWIERSLFYFANAYQRAMTIWRLPHNAGYCFFFRKSAFEPLGGCEADASIRRRRTHEARNDKATTIATSASVIHRAVSTSYASPITKTTYKRTAYFARPPRET